MFFNFFLKINVFLNFLKKTKTKMDSIPFLSLCKKSITIRQKNKEYIKNFNEKYSNNPRSFNKLEKLISYKYFRMIVIPFLFCFKHKLKKSIPTLVIKQIMEYITLIKKYAIFDMGLYLYRFKVNSQKIETIQFQHNVANRIITVKNEISFHNFCYHEHLNVKKKT